MLREINVLFIWEVDERLRGHFEESLRRVPNVRLAFPPDGSQETLLRLAPDADVIVGWRPTKETLLAAEKLQLFINPGAGIQHLVPLFREVTSSREVLLANCHGNSYFVAQHAVALLLALTNKLVPHHSWMVAGEWRKKDEDARSLPLRDRRVGLLGYGAVNQKVHRFLSGFDLKFSILRRSWKKRAAKLPSPANKYTSPELLQFLGEIDTLIVAVPLTRHTEDLIRTRELELLGSRGLLVNVARGSVINEEDLYNALERGVIAGAAIDVWYNYDPSPDSKGHKYPSSCPFHKLPNVVMSPHRAASPFDDLQRWNEVIENIRRFAEGNKTILNLVDLEREY